MKITVLCENTTASPLLQPEHGLSLLIETKDKTILFDMGQTDLFLRNAMKMSIPLENVDLSVLSHGHYDHSGGLKSFLSVNAHANVYVSPYIFGQYYNADRKYIGVDHSVKFCNRVLLTPPVHRLAPGLTLFSCNHLNKPFPIFPHKLTEKCGDTFLEDHFLHEQYLLIQEGKKRVLFSGCSHNGILNVLSWFRPDVFVGGFHLMNLSLSVPEEKAQIEQVADFIRNHNILCYTGHCTGEEQVHFLKDKLRSLLIPLSTGNAYSIF